MRFSKVRQLLVDFQLIPSPSLDFQVGLNLDETAPLITGRLIGSNVTNKPHVPLQIGLSMVKICGKK